jgi:hypothetical protein
MGERRGMIAAIVTIAVGVAVVLFRWEIWKFLNEFFNNIPK